MRDDGVRLGDAGMEAFTATTQPATDAASRGDYNLIGQYAAARADKNDAQATALLAPKRRASR